MISVFVCRVNSMEETRVIANAVILCCFHLDISFFKLVDRQKWSGLKWIV